MAKKSRAILIAGIVIFSVVIFIINTQIRKYQKASAAAARPGQALEVPAERDLSDDRKPAGNFSVEGQGMPNTSEEGLLLN